MLLVPQTVAMETASPHGRLLDFKFLANHVFVIFPNFSERIFFCSSSFFILFPLFPRSSFTPPSRYGNQAPGTSFGSPPPSECAQWQRESPHPLAPSSNRLPLLHLVCQRSAAAGQSGKSGLQLVGQWERGEGPLTLMS